MTGLVRLSTIFLSLFLLVGCAMPILPPPTPTTVTGTLLPFEMLLSGTHCDALDSDYKVFFAASEVAWNDIRSELQANEILREVESTLLEVVAGTDFETKGVILAVRGCKSSPIPSFIIDRIVEIAHNKLAIYVELREPVPGSVSPAVADGYYEIGRIPWPADHAESPTVEVVGYSLWSE